MVKTGQIAIYYGAGKGKTSVSLGKGILALGENLRVVMIQFMDYHNNQEIALLEKLEAHGGTQLGEHQDITLEVSRRIYEAAR